MITIDETGGPWITLHIWSEYRKITRTPEKTMSKVQKQKIKAERQARLAKTLRENLLKRKAQLRARLEKEGWKD